MGAKHWRGKVRGLTSKVTVPVGAAPPGRFTAYPTMPTWLPSIAGEGCATAVKDMGSACTMHMGTGLKINA